MEPLEWRRPRWVFTTIAAVLSGPANVGGLVLVLPAMQDAEFNLREFLWVYALLATVPCMLGTAILALRWSLHAPSQLNYASDALYVSAFTALLYSPIAAVVVVGGRLQDIDSIAFPDLLGWIGMSGITWIFGAIIWIPAMLFSQYIWRSIAFTR